MAGQVSRFWPVGPILQAFVDLGCELRVAEEMLSLPDGDVVNLRYLFRPETSAFVALVDLSDEDRVSESEVEFWEDRLGLGIPRPDAT